MLTTLAISNYRSLLHLVIPLGRLNVITGLMAAESLIFTRPYDY